MRVCISLSLAAALAVASVVPATAGNLVGPKIEGETAVAPQPAGSMGGLGAGAVVGIALLLALAAGGSSSTPGTNN